MSLELEWDEEKASSNQKKHKVSFEEAASVFADPLAAIFDDEVHSKEEQREIIIGHSAKNRLLLVSSTERAGAIRISAPVEQRKGSVKIMTKTRTTKQSSESEDDLLPEYRFDYRKARPNRFASRLKPGSRAVVLDPDVAAVFATPESVNAVLRALIETMPRRNSR
jgi:uncharacterized DUF497 family protein